MKHIPIALVSCLLAACASTSGGHNPNGAAQFERMKSLQGDWISPDPHGQAGATASFHYEVTGGGSALVETIAPHGEGKGTMLTVYHLDGDDLVLTHYCMLGNQPHMVAAPSKDPNVVHFGFAGGSNVDMKHGQHMHEATYHFVDANHVQSDWTLYTDGKATGTGHFELTRK
jgi:hypothetical protein